MEPPPVTDPQDDDWKTPDDALRARLEGSVAARWHDYVAKKLGHDMSPVLSLGIGSLDEVVTLHTDSPKVVVVALPWEPAGETPFVVAQALAKQGASPLCVHPGWSPYWDGPLDVHRLGDPPGPVSYESIEDKTGAHQPVIIDQFSRLHWDSVSSHADREDVVSAVGQDLHSLASRRQAPVIVFLCRRTRDVVRMSVDDLRSDGALEYDVDVLVMVDPHPDAGDADLLVVKHRNGPTGLRTGVPWPVLPRTVYRRPDR